MKLGLKVVFGGCLILFVASRFYQAPSKVTPPIEPAAPIDTGAKLDRETVKRNVYQDQAFAAAIEMQKGLVSARARFWLDEARRVESASGQPVEGFLLDRMATNNQRLRAVSTGRKNLPVADLEKTHILLLDQLAFQVAFYRLYNGNMPEGFPEAFQVDIGVSLKATADFNDDRRLAINGEKKDGKP